jgi:hypothetical protein
MRKIDKNYLTYSLNESYINENNPYDINRNKYTTLPESTKEREILNSMKESLDVFLLNLKTKLSSNNNANEDNYFLTENEILNSFDVNLLTSYQNLLLHNINKNDYPQKKVIKRAYSSEQVKNMRNRAQMTNYNFNSYKTNNYYDSNANDIINNSIFYEDNENTNKSLIIKDYNNKDNNKNKSLTINSNNNNTPNISQHSYVNKKNLENRNNKYDYPMKLIANNNFNCSFNKNNIKMIKKNNYNNKIKNTNITNIMLYIREELKKIKKKIIKIK